MEVIGFGDGVRRMVTPFNRWWAASLPIFFTCALKREDGQPRWRESMFFRI
jgi:hypothetical protein